jgi:tRNA 5-methylaminomethyl-2-thiouridine biosynthesis bifunctional protein
MQQGPVEWGSDGTPRSPRFDDVYRPASGGLEQARHVFLEGCGLPQAWRGQPQWRVLETGFGLGLNFLATWHAWRNDSQRPRLLHFVSVEAWPVRPDDLRRSVEAYPELQPLADQLAREWWGLLRGVHRIAFDNGQVLLTLCVGDVRDMLRQLQFQADSVFLDGFNPRSNAEMWELSTLKGVARLVRRGAGVATWTAAGDVRRDLAQCGFQVEKTEGVPPKRHSLRGRYDPAWEPKGAPAGNTHTPGRCAVIGAGLAGAATAASLARRGWQVQVFDAAQTPAAGASSLPAGLMEPHQSPDDNLLSRLTRAGVRATLQQAQELLRAGGDWQLTGALEYRMDDARPVPSLGEQLLPWTREASAEEKAQAGLEMLRPAWWHDKAAWIKPAALVRAWLAHPAIAWHGGRRISRLARDAAQWRLLGEDGVELARTDLVVVAAAYASGPLIGDRLALHPVRGQVSWSFERPDTLPACPVNGNGHFLPAVPLEAGTAWLSGSTYGRGDTGTDIRAEDHAANLQRLQVLLPGAAAQLAGVFAAGRVQGWAGVRCTSGDRRPLVGLLEPGLAVSTAMGSRGLTFAALCAELLAARLHGEPLPLEGKLAEALSPGRQVRATAA